MEYQEHEAETVDVCIMALISVSESLDPYFAIVQLTPATHTHTNTYVLNITAVVTVAKPFLTESHQYTEKLHLNQVNNTP